MLKTLRGFLLLCAVSLALSVTGPGVLFPAFAWDDEDCDSCHGDPSIAKEGGAYLYVDSDRFRETSHADVGCTSCHDSVSEDHPDDNQRPSRAGCGECHDVEAEYAESEHFENADCIDCHDPHNVRPLVGVSAVEVNRTCMECHAEEDVVESHGVWLPQTILHIRSLPCIACHTASEEFTVTFYVESVTHGMSLDPTASPATYDQLKSLAGEKEDVASIVDGDGDGKVSVEELRTFYRRAKARDMRLWGMITPEEVTHDFTTLDNRWDCSFCHARGPETLQESFMALPGPHGRFRRIPVEASAVQGALYGSPDFYMIGATRSKVLNILGALIVLGGLAVPIFHGTVRLLTMRYRKREK